MAGRSSRRQEYVYNLGRCVQNMHITIAAIGRRFATCSPLFFPDPFFLELPILIVVHRSEEAENPARVVADLWDLARDGIAWRSGFVFWWHFCPFPHSFHDHSRGNLGNMEVSTSREGRMEDEWEEPGREGMRGMKSRSLMLLLLLFAGIARWINEPRTRYACPRR